MVVSSSSSSFTSSAGVFVGLGAGCTQVGTWLLLGNSSTRLSGSSSSLYVHANWDRMTLSLVWNTQKEKKTLNPPDMMGMMGISDSGQVAQVFRFQHLPKKKRDVGERKQICLYCTAHEPEHLDGGAVTINAQRAWRYTSDTGEL